MLLRALLLSIATALTPAAAQSDSLTRAGLAGMTGSERLRQFSLGQAVLDSDAPALTRAMEASLRDSGFYHTGSGPVVLSRSVRVDPVLAWDGNINGGFLNDRFDIFGLTFDVDPARRALPGVVAGARAGGQIRLAYGEGRFLDLRGSIEAAWSPEHDIGRSQAGFEACARNHLSGWNFADLCVTASHSIRRLSTSTSATVDLSFARLHAGRASEHEFSAGIARTFAGGSTQDALSLGWNAVWNRAVTGLDLTLAAPIPGETAMRQRIHGSVGWQWQGRAMRLGVWHQRSDGGVLLGMPRADRVTGISLSVQAHRNLTVEVVHQVTQSTVNLFDENRTGLNLRLDLHRR